MNENKKVVTGEWLGEYGVGQLIVNLFMSDSLFKLLDTFKRSQKNVKKKINYSMCVCQLWHDYKLDE